MGPPPRKRHAAWGGITPAGHAGWPSFGPSGSGAHSRPSLRSPWPCRRGHGSSPRVLGERAMMAPGSWGPSASSYPCSLIRLVRLDPCVTTTATASSRTHGSHRCSDLPLAELADVHCFETRQPGELRVGFRGRVLPHPRLLPEGGQAPSARPYAGGYLSVGHGSPFKHSASTHDSRPGKMHP